MWAFNAQGQLLTCFKEENFWKENKHLTGYWSCEECVLQRRKNSCFWTAPSSHNVSFFFFLKIGSSMKMDDELKKSNKAFWVQMLHKCLWALCELAIQPVTLTHPALHWSPVSFRCFTHITHTSTQCTCNYFPIISARMVIKMYFLQTKIFPLLCFLLCIKTTTSLLFWLSLFNALLFGMGPSMVP